MLARTYCREVIFEPAGELVRVCGWVRSVHPDHFELWDWTGLVEVEFAIDPRPTLQPGNVVDLLGDVRQRANPTKIACHQITLVNECVAGAREEVGPFSPHSYLRFRDHSRLDLLRVSNRAARAVRELLSAEGCIEIHTPILWQSVQEYGEPEIAVSHPNLNGQKVVLLQSPLVTSLLSAIGGIERSFQFARCFRTEGDVEDPLKSCEFTQLNITLTFTTLRETQRLIERLLGALFEEIVGIELPGPFPTIAYDDCILRYGDDRPDFRYPECLLPRFDPADVGLSTSNGAVQGMLVPNPLPPEVAFGIETALRRESNNHFGIASVGSDSVTWIGNLRLRRDLRAVLAELGAAVPATLLLAPGPTERARALLRHLLQAAEPFMHGRARPRFAPVWIERFPFLQSPSGSLTPGMHRSRSLFARRMDASAPPEQQTSVGFDLVVNGTELASGGEKEYRADRFAAGLTAAGVVDTRSYDHYVTALKSGAPPLSNTAIGWDRLLWVMLQTPRMHDLMLLPSNSRGMLPVGAGAGHDWR